MEFVKIIMNTTLANHRSNCPPDITDLVFLEIEKNFMKVYETCIFKSKFGNSKKGRGEINKKIGRLIKLFWDLKNLKKEHHPYSNLIKSYTIHSN
jgi:hypothetical protein